MTATDELRRLLDERGVEYFKHEDGEPLRKLEKAEKPATSWRMGGASVCAVPIEDSDLFDLWIDHCTPEQAAAATLNARAERTCRNVDEYANAGFFTCGACGFGRNGIELTPNYCPACGAKVIGGAGDD